MNTEKKDIASLDLPELTDYLEVLSEKSGVKFEKFRAKQIFSWLMKGISDFSEMSNISSRQRVALSENCYIALPKIHKKFVSKLDGTIKYLFELFDGEKIESVFMRYKHGNTICISTQAGCRMGCSFCASTLAGLSRHLTPSEMIGQILAAQNDTGERISNIVMMGIGEPLDNYDNSIKFLRLVNHPDGINIGYRHISLSTCGIVPGIYRLAEENLPITLSISLHAPTQQYRESIMPVARKWNIDQLIKACKDYIGVTGRRISFEYAMIDGVNDSTECAKNLSGLLSGMLCHVNLIPLNDVKEREYKKSSTKAIECFVRTLEKNGITTTVRRRLGSDINASCGQLRRDEDTNTNI
ncbi:MAG: 23S rRNA (adenine(2503)-C(2))-methyltransferase RlmN [Clostridia bacterium]|nr:23S rRNA (adenine(2503)-C(2))-methyltransferase RlmN [Clostridia bacterium]